jgi:hypothetical protein
MQSYLKGPFMVLLSEFLLCSDKRRKDHKIEHKTTSCQNPLGSTGNCGEEYDSGKLTWDSRWNTGLSLSHVLSVL